MGGFGGWGGGSRWIWEGEAGVGEAETQMLLRWSSTVNNLPLGKSSWLEFPCGPESLIPATRSGLQLFSVTHTAWGPISCHTTDYFQGWTLGLTLQSLDLLHQVKRAVQVPARADSVFVLNMLSLEAISPSWPKAKHHILVWRSHRRASASKPLSLFRRDI